VQRADRFRGLSLALRGVRRVEPARLAGLRLRIGAFRPLAFAASARPRALLVRQFKRPER
jgi:hypothetical protein